MSTEQNRIVQMPIPIGGICQTTTDKTEWIGECRVSAIRDAALCQHCPALTQCRDYAAEHKWVSVCVAGWRAPAEHPVFPPWRADPNWEPDWPTTEAMTRHVKAHNKYMRRRRAKPLDG